MFLTKKVNINCRYFRGDRPCKYHKQEGAKCGDCKFYEPVKTRVLIIKLDSPGDVLRTTFILPSLFEKYPSSHITWLTKKEAAELLRNNPYIDQIWECGWESFSFLSTQSFDFLLSLEVSREGGSLAILAHAREKLGFGLSPEGWIYPLNPEAKGWWEMGIWDDLKKANIKSYHEIILEICLLPPKMYEPILHLTEKELEWGRGWASSQQIKEDRPTIGLNTGAGKRWRLKRWTEEGFLGLIDRISEELKANILLLGGPEEIERNQRLLSQSGAMVISSGCENSLRRFASILNFCDLVVTSDTLALHMALALGKKVVALFGPTSPSEIELYGRGKEITPPMDCLCCYTSDCSKRPNCMEMIGAAEVFEAVKGLLGR